MKTIVEYRVPIYMDDGSESLSEVGFRADAEHTGMVLVIGHDFCLRLSAADIIGAVRQCVFSEEAGK